MATAARFPPQARLHRPREFEALFAAGSRLSERWFTALVAPNDGGAPRLGLAVAKKTAALAVDRNRIKRCIRESFRCAQSHLPAVDIVILTRPGCPKATRRELQAGLARLWQKIGRRPCAAPASS